MPSISVGTLSRQRPPSASVTSSFAYAQYG
jgi:hypothetical protein